MGRRAAEVVAGWGPERFARGCSRRLELAGSAERRDEQAATGESSTFAYARDVTESEFARTSGGSR